MAGIVARKDIRNLEFVFLALRQLPVKLFHREHTGEREHAAKRELSNFWLFEVSD